MKKYIIIISSPQHNVEWEESIESDNAMEVSEYVYHLAKIHLNKEHKLTIDPETNSMSYSDGESVVTGIMVLD